MKKGLLLSIIIMMLACLALPALAAKASTPGNQSVSHPEEIEDGGWSAPENAGITDALAEIFDKATSDLEDFEYEPVALIESKIVAGYCYRFLCETKEKKDNEEPGIAVVEIFLDLDGNAKVISIEEEEVHSMSEVAAFAENASPAEGTMQTIQGNAGEVSTATCTVTFVKE